MQLISFGQHQWLTSVLTVLANEWKVISDNKILNTESAGSATITHKPSHGSTRRDTECKQPHSSINWTRARSRWGAIANPHAKALDSPSTLQSHPGAWPWQQNENSVQYVFYILFVRTHTKFGIKIFEIDMVTEIEWYLTFDLTPRSPVWP